MNGGIFVRLATVRLRDSVRSRESRKMVIGGGGGGDPEGTRPFSFFQARFTSRSFTGRSKRSLLYQMEKRLLDRVSSLRSMGSTTKTSITDSSAPPPPIIPR